MDFNLFGNKEERVNQVLQKNSDMRPLNIMFYVGKSVCKIESSDSFGSGFFIKLLKGNKDLYCLMTNRHVITKKMVVLKQKLNISYDNLKYNFTLELDSNKRKIRDFNYMNFDAIIIEILLTDKVDYQYFLLPDMNYKNGYNQYLTKKIYILQYPLGQFLQGSDGSIININEDIDLYEFTHTASTLNGSSGSPVFLDGSMNVIGIHKQGSQSGNIAHFIGPIIDSLLKDNYEEKEYENGDIYQGEMINNKREGVGKLIMKNGECYLGQWHNDNVHGFAKQYYPNKNLKYKGNFINNEYNGLGIYAFENGEFYEGFFRNSMANGFGIYHYINGDFYEGDFVDNLKSGKGKYMCSNGNYFIGKWKNDMQNGYGEYYENNKPVYKGHLIKGRKSGYGEYYIKGFLKYRGFFIDDKYDGEGLSISSSSFYYGKWLFGKKNGNGIEYFNDKNLDDKFPYEFYFKDLKFIDMPNMPIIFKYCYVGNFMNGKKNGKGKLYNIPKKKLIYDGEWENGLKSGEGTEYYCDGKLKYKGHFSLGCYNGAGELYWKNGNYYNGNFIQGELNGNGKLFGYYSDSYLDKFVEKSIISFEDIKEYDGEFVRNKKEGFGTVIYKDGSRYQGFWKNDKYDGEGIFFKANGEYITGHWEDGKKIGKMTLFDQFGEYKTDGDFNQDTPTNDSFWKNLKSKFYFRINK